MDSLRVESRLHMVGRRTGMVDVIMVLITAAFFGLSFAMVRWFDRI